MPVDLPMDSRLPLGAIGLGPDTHKIPVSTSIAEIAGAIYCFFIACSCFVGSQFQTTRKYIKKAWNLLVLGDIKFTRFLYTKTSANKRLLIMS